MTCRSRYLTADGRVLVCEWDDHEPDPYEHVNYGHPFAPDEGTRWVSDDPCAWEAPDCPECKGETWDEFAFADGPCHVCGGTGVDDTVPPRMVGAGSIVTPKPDHWRYGEWSVRLLLVLLSDRGGLWSTGLHRHSGDPAQTAHVPLDFNGWRVVRAVPPAHTGDTP